MTLMEEISKIVRRETGVSFGNMKDRGQNPTTRQQQEVIEIVQTQVGRYYKEDLDSNINISRLRSKFGTEAETMGIPADLLAAYDEMNVNTVIKTLHMTCTIQSWFCQRILRQYGFEVFGVDCLMSTIISL